MTITVAICTWNRSKILFETLSNFNRIRVPKQVDLEIVIVNNNCTDNTEQIVNKFTNKLPIKKVYEPTPGLSNARNAAISAASGEYIIWTDDDVLVEEDWLAAYANAFKKHSESAVFGGPVEPWFEGSPPAWLKNNWASLSDAFAARDLGAHEREFAVEGRVLPFGANFAIKTSVQKNYLYDPNLGLCAGKMILDEETKVLCAILNDGYQGWWIPGAKVKHWIPKSRQSLHYLENYYVGYGRTICRKEKYGPFKTVFGYPRWALRKYLSLAIQYSIVNKTTTTSSWVKYFKEKCKYKGICLEYKQLYKKATPNQ